MTRGEEYLSADITVQYAQISVAWSQHRIVTSCRTRKPTENMWPLKMVVRPDPHPPTDPVLPGLPDWMLADW